MKMRLHTQIFSAAFVVLFSILQVHPIFIDYKVLKEQTGATTEPAACAKPKKTVCSRSKCTLPINTDEQEACNSNGCNPCVPCNTGVFCYLVESIFSYTFFYTTAKASLFHFDDNRTQNSLSECWHPPENWS